MVICVFLVSWDRTLDAISVEFRLAAGAEYLQSACVTHGVGPGENPVLPCRQAAEYTRFQRLARTETQVRFHAGQGVGRQRASLFERDAYLVVPVEGIGSGGDESEGLGRRTLEPSAHGGTRLGDEFGIAIEARLDPRSPMHRRKQAEIRLGENRHGAARCGVLIEHVNAVRRERELEERPRETAAGLDQGK